MEHGRNNGDEREAVDRLAPHVVLKEERIIREDEKDEGAEVEIVPVETRGLRTLRPPHATFHVRAEQVPEERARGEDEDRDQTAGEVAPREVRFHRQRNPPLEETDDRAGGRAPEEATPRLPVAEQPVPVREDAAPVDRPAAAPEDRPRG